MTGGGHFRHPGRRWLLCETGYFADLGVGDMPGARARPQNRHPGGGGSRAKPIAKLQAMMLAPTRTPLAPHPRPPRAANAAHSRAQARAATSLRKPQRGVRPSAAAETMTKGVHFRHPGGGGRLSATDN